MFKKILLAAVSLVSLMTLFFAVWPVPYTKWSGLQIAYPSVRNEKTLAEQLGYSRSLKWTPKPEQFQCQNKL